MEELSMDEFTDKNEWDSVCKTRGLTGPYALFGIGGLYYVDEHTNVKAQWNEKLGKGYVADAGVKSP
jgi:hypothetical protein